MGLLVARSSVCLISKWNMVCLEGPQKSVGSLWSSRSMPGRGLSNRAPLCAVQQPGTSCLPRNPPGSWGGDLAPAAMKNNFQSLEEERVRTGQAP